MTVFQNFQNSNAWDARYNLPLVPIHNNPWIYLAYAVKLIANGQHTNDELIELVDLIEDQLERCKSDEAGEWWRWPGERGGPVSHDELMGLGYLGWKLGLPSKPAQKILSHLNKTDGEYNLTNEDGIPERYNVYRFVFLTPFLRACTKKEFRLGWLSQIMFCFHVGLDAVTYKLEHGDEGARLRMWLMMEPMEAFPLPRLVLGWWKEKMEKLGLSPKKLYEKYLAECPVYRENAPTKF